MSREDRNLDTVHRRGSQVSWRMSSLAASRANIVSRRQDAAASGEQGQHPGGSAYPDWNISPVSGQSFRGRGIFLERTWRLHPSLCRSCRTHFMKAGSNRRFTHTDNCSSSTDTTVTARRVGAPIVSGRSSGQWPAERRRAARRCHYRALLGKTWINQKGERQSITVMNPCRKPYNMQVNSLLRTLPTGARVGTLGQVQGSGGCVVSSPWLHRTPTLLRVGSTSCSRATVSTLRCPGTMPRGDVLLSELLDHVCAYPREERFVNTVWGQRNTQARNVSGPRYSSFVAIPCSRSALTQNPRRLTKVTSQCA